MASLICGNGIFYHAFSPTTTTTIPPAVCLFAVVYLVDMLIELHFLPCILTTGHGKFLLLLLPLLL